MAGRLARVPVTVADSVPSRTVSGITRLDRYLTISRHGLAETPANQVFVVKQSPAY